LTQVAGVKPAPGVEHRRHARFLPVSSLDIFAAHENLAVGREFYVYTRQRLADRAAAQAERMIHADQRSSFREAVALNDRVTKAVPEFLRFGRERRAARNDGPEFPA